METEPSGARNEPGCLHEWLFRLRSVESVKGDGAGGLKQQLVFSYALVVVTSGEVQLLLDRQQVDLEQGSVCVCPPDRTFGTASMSGNSEMYVFYFDVFGRREEAEDGLGPVKEAHLFSHSGKITVYPSDELVSMCGKLFSGWRSNDKLGPFRCQIDFQELLYHIARNSRAKPDSAHAALEFAKQYIEEHYTEPLTVDRLAQMADLSPKYFGDLFKKKYGRSAMDYVAELRLTQAKRLMAQSDLRLRDIAHQVGYADEFYFSRKFKKEIGISPAAYMRSRRRKVAVYSPALLGQLLPLQIMPFAAPLHPKWTEYYYRKYRNEIPVHISAYRHHQEWEANIELLRQVPADLVLALDDISEAEKQALEKIAPVFYLPAEGADWKRQFRLLAEFLGESWQAEQWLQWYAHSMQAGKERLRQAMAGESVAVVRMLNDSLFLYCDRGMAGTLYRGLELKPAYDCGQELYDVPVTPAELGDLNADHLLLMIRQESETLGSWKRLQDDPKWQAIPAVQRHRLCFLTSDPWREYSAYAHLRMLKQAVRLLSAVRPS